MTKWQTQAVRVPAPSSQVREAVKGVSKFIPEGVRAHPLGAKRNPNPDVKLLVFASTVLGN